MAYDKETDTYGTDSEIAKIVRDRDLAKKREKLAKKNKAVVDFKAGKREARQQIGTPVGNKQRLQQFKEMLLKDVNGSKVITKVLEIAMNDEHPGQVSAIKMCLDRMLPVSTFEETKKDGSRTAIQITISGIGESKVIPNDDIEDAEVID